MQNDTTVARRRLMALASAGLFMLGAGARARAQAQPQQEKLSKPEAEYQDTPKNDTHAANAPIPAAERLLGGLG